MAWSKPLRGRWTTALGIALLAAFAFLPEPLFSDTPTANSGSNGAAGSLEISQTRRFTLPASYPGKAGLITGDFNGNGVPEIIVAEENIDESFWYSMEFDSGDYRKVFVSDPMDSRIAEMNLATLQGDEVIAVVTENGTVALHDSVNFELLQLLDLPASQWSVTNFSMVTDPQTNQMLIFVAYGPSMHDSHPVLAYSWPDLKLLWETTDPESDVADIEVANLDGDPGLELAMVADSELRVLDWDTRTEQWSFPYPGPPRDIKAGNLDADPGLEITGVFDEDHLFIADVASQTTQFVAGVTRILSLNLGDINADGTDEIIAGRLTHSGTYIIDALGLSVIAEIDNGIFTGGGGESTAVGDFDLDGFYELAYASTSHVAEHNVVKVQDIFTHQEEYTALGVDSSHQEFEIFDIDADGLDELIILSDVGGGEASRARVYDYGSGVLEWISDEDIVFQLRDDAASPAFDLAPLDADPQWELVVPDHTGRISIYDGADGAFQQWVTLDPVSQGSLVRSVRSRTLDGAPRWVIWASSRMAIFDMDGKLEWESDNLGFWTVLDYWFADTDGAPGEELVVAHTAGLATFNLSQSSWVDLLTITISYALYEDVDDDGTAEFVLSNAAGAIEIVQPHPLEVEDTFFAAAGASAVSFAADEFIGQALVVSNPTGVSYIDLSSGTETTIFSDFAGQNFGRHMTAGFHNAALRVAIGSSYAVHNFTTRSDIIFRDGME